ncbi:ethanolamine utilization protein EutH [Metabacillus rhizolycopersici]|uniref:Ethanolamine utilization protein EutH n=1 Tax=Metabacillus rhizolycopersici TaxID=2875709 RepID=A0ABS7UY57_9BACI|nr:ethanolamine utilization protein EutH [Metabacillus rhizolycopersici]MBZ5753253.1 ethanolamine utilization protein EutH [Metabacillus rhizolycopersici]
MEISNIIVYIMVVFLCLGAIDKCMGNRMGLGQKFSDGFMAMGSLTMAMVGIVSISPILAKFLIPVITPIYGLVGADPSTFANTLLAVDMGGYALAKEMATNPEAEVFSWVFLGTMMGPTIAFTIPVALGIIEKEDHPYFAKGILLGITTVPFGCLVGGIVADLSLKIVLMNLIPTVIFSILVAIGLWKATDMMIKGFHLFGKCIEIIAILGLTAVIIETLTGFIIIPNMTPITEGIKTVGMIAITLAGAFPMIAFITKVLKKYLEKLGYFLGISDTSTAGLIASLANNIPMLTTLKNMEPRGKVMNVAFTVSAAFVFGGNLGFVAGVNKEMVFAMIVGKLVGGITAIALAIITTSKSTT